MWCVYIRRLRQICVYILEFKCFLKPLTMFVRRNIDILHVKLWAHPVKLRILENTDSSLLPYICWPNVGLLCLETRGGECTVLEIMESWLLNALICVYVCVGLLSHSHGSDCGYSSSMEGSETGSREGSDVACTEGMCNHDETGTRFSVLLLDGWINNSQNYNPISCFSGITWEKICIPAWKSLQAALSI